MALYENITTEDQFVDYIKLKIGQPVINLEETDDQIKQNIWDSIQDFRRYNYEEGSYKDYAIMSIPADTTTLALSAFSADDGRRIDDVESIYDFGVPTDLDGINTLFSPAHILLYDQFVTRGQYPGVGSVEGLTLTSYQLAMMYIEELKNMFSKRFTLFLINGNTRIRIVPTPNQAVTGVFVFYRREYTKYLYNHPLIKRLAVARTKIQVGRHLGKYSGNLPDQLSINYQMFIDEGKEEEEKALEEIFKSSAPPDFFIA